MVDTIETIRADLCCPQCEYNLRGLSGAVVDCPECGHACDLAYLISLRNRLAWYTAPGYFRLVLPIWWIVLVVICTAMLVFAVDESTASAMMPAVYFAAFAVWVWLLIRCWQHYQSVHGVVLAVLMHFVYAAYMLGGLMSFSSLLLLGNGTVGLFQALLALVAGIWMIFLARKAQLYVARRCIARYFAGVSA